ncbi:auxin-responsive GH3 family protein [Actinidia rufa]|uniref:Auxin-responsive GH3 family protein n=1 Tax=Actinidia rufa TaxID=165716 RepID=A0A7J0G893_9ERIC|nr:auxin-responsive GH3 family protein [Actinidia rufa]
MEVLSIQQHARDTLSRLRMRKRNKNWARDHMSWGNLRYHPKDWAGICWLVVGLGWRLVVLLLTLGCDCGLHRVGCWTVFEVGWADEQGCLGVKGRGGDGTETWARGAAQRQIWWVVAGQRLGGPAQRLDRGGWWMCGVWTEAGQKRIWVGQRRIWVVLRLDRGESGLHRGEAGDWAEQGLHRDVGRRAVQSLILLRMLLTSDPTDNKAGMKLLEYLTTDVKQIQEQVLDEILTQNANTDYLQGFLACKTEKELFMKEVPIVNYEDIKPYIERIANAEPYVEGLEQGKAKPSLHKTRKPALQRLDEVLRVGAVFASAFLRALKFMEDHRRELCCNIRSGHWELVEGIIKKLWPKTKYIEVIVTGSMAKYIPTLEFYIGGLHLVSTMYVSSECYLGINLKPLTNPCDVSYTLLPNMAYFEFLPLGEKHDTLPLNPRVQCNGVSAPDTIKMDNQSELVSLVDVKLGHYYELVVTTFTGLYRYRVGDILMVTGFYNNAPQFRFVQRQNVVLSINTDKTSEEDLLKAVAQAKLIIEPLGFLLTEYTSYADPSSVPGHYVIFWELKTRGRRSDEALEIDPSTMGQCCSTVEESLDSVYRRCRKKDNSIGPLEIRVVNHGTFDALMDYCVSKGSSVNQYKTPRCIKSEEAPQVLDSRLHTYTHYGHTQPQDPRPKPTLNPSPKSSDASRPILPSAGQYSIATRLTVLRATIKQPWMVIQSTIDKPPSAIQLEYLETAAALWALVDEIDGARVADRGGSTARATRGAKKMLAVEMSHAAANWREAVVVDRA